MSSIQSILDKSLQNERITPKESLKLLQSKDWTSIVKAGHLKRQQFVEPSKVSYTAFLMINYTNICDIDCSFCSFKEDVASGNDYTLNLKKIEERLKFAQKRNVNQIFLQGGVHKDLSLLYYTEVLQLITQQYKMDVRGFSPVEIYRLAEKENLSLEKLLTILKESGLSSVPGAGAEILSARMRDILSPKKLSARQWCNVMGEAHKLNLLGSSNIVFGSVETSQEIIEHLTYIRNQQDLTKGFKSFIPWIFQQQTKKFKVRYIQKWEYLRMIALSRLFFDNIQNIEVSVMVMGKELAELALYSGANDMSSIVLEENVLKSYGIPTVEGAQKFITNAGFTPIYRNMNYKM